MEGESDLIREMRRVVARVVEKLREGPYWGRSVLVGVDVSHESSGDWIPGGMRRTLRGRVVVASRG